LQESTLLSIKEFSDFTGINQSTLRYYDEIDLLPAALRGENNYRYYAPFQIIKLNYINVLIDLGVPLSVIKDMDKQRTPENVIDLLRKQEVKLDYKLSELRTAYSIIHTYITNIQNGLMVEDGTVRVEKLEAAHYVLGGLNDFTKNNDTFYEEFIRFCQNANKRRINLRYPVGGYHENIDSFMKSPGRPDRFFSADPLGNSTRPEGNYLVAYNRGYYGEFGDMPQKILDYAQDHDLVFKGPVQIIFVLDEISIPEPGQYLSRFIVGVSQKKQSKTRKPQ